MSYFFFSIIDFILIAPKNYFILQGKERLITELRQELNVTDVEHGELLWKIISDESFKMIRCFMFVILFLHLFCFNFFFSITMLCFTFPSPVAA